MQKVRYGVIGLGVMGQAHVKTINSLDNSVVTAICDLNAANVAKIREDAALTAEVRDFDCYKQLIDSGLCDAVAVVTPHPFHLEAVEYAFAKGLHVMCDKPLSSSVSEAGRMIDAWKRGGGKLKFSTMFVRRGFPVHQKTREIIKSGELGEIQRVDFVSTTWLRTQKYYDCQSWRGTWKGEGGGLLLNQAPHDLDILYYLYGEAAAVDAKVDTRFHRIETEDETEAYIRTQAGFPIRFYATTGEYPGWRRMEIVFTGGYIREESNQLQIVKLENDSREILAMDEAFPAPEDLKYSTQTLEFTSPKNSHAVIFENLSKVIIEDLGNECLLSPGSEGIASVEWANAMLTSQIEGCEIALPLDRAKYDTLLNDLCEGRRNLKK